MVLAHHYCVRRWRSPGPADFKGGVKLVLLVHLEGHSLCAKSCIPFNEATDLGMQLFLVCISGINKTIFERFWPLNCNCKCKLVTDKLIQFCCTHLHVRVRQSNSKLELGKANSIARSLVHDAVVVAQSK